MNKQIAIAGMGWLGLPLAHRLKILGYNVKGSVSSQEKANDLRNSGWDVFPIMISEDGVAGSVNEFLSEVKDIIIMIPSGLRRNTGSDYVLKMSHFLSEIEASEIENIIFVSSTSVYGDAQGKVTEKDLPKPENEAGRQLLQVEQLFFTSSCPTSIVRFGGLYGGSRQPARYLAGRENLSNGNAPVNLIHRDDCISILIEIVKQQAYGHIFNAVHPSHPAKSSYYIQKTKDLGLEPPSFEKEEAATSFKQVDSVHLKPHLDFSFSEEL
ncbi:NAD(P)-binding domain-containing protein [Aureisphaera galaxeae]|uniref:NAD(P)-binding domain-containing protein n=1 Tax=Aureisphaera galaxeae TaxID=1538023 RepID=UPI00235034D7|nr:NAD(P)-binding domain-containing protein [Aureisphaera galaxeae]MDC8002534.1 NAD(P)-binding domain-containing protein [Aureisphaera galaxeae]